MATEKLIRNKKVMTADDVLSGGVAYAEVPGFEEGKVLRIRSLASGDFIEWSEQRDKGPEHLRVAGLTLIIKSVCDEDGNLIFKAEDLESLKKVRHTFIESILKEISKLNELFGAKAGDAKKD